MCVCVYSDNSSFIAHFIHIMNLFVLCSGTLTTREPHLKDRRSEGKTGEKKRDKYECGRYKIQTHTHTAKFEQSFAYRF